MQWFRPGDWSMLNTSIYFILTDHFSYSKLSVTIKMGDLKAHLSHIKNGCKGEENKLFSVLVKNQENKKLIQE